MYKSFTSSKMSPLLIKISNNFSTINYSISYINEKNFLLEKIKITLIK